MKSITVIFVILFLFFISAFSQPVTVSMLYFNFDPQNIDQDLHAIIKNGIPDFISIRLEQSKKVILVERRRIDKLIDEYKIAQSGLIDEEAASQIGQMIKAQYVVFGNVIQLPTTELVIIARVVNINTGVVTPKKVQGPKWRIQDLCSQLGDKLLSVFFPITQVSKPVAPSESATSPTIASNVTTLAATAHYYRANDFVNINDWDSAIIEYKKAIELDSLFSRAYVNLGVAYLRKNRVDIAQQIINDALKISPNSELAHFNMGLIYCYMNELDKAISEFKHALQLNPYSIEVFIELGKAYYSKRDYKKAIKAYREALKLDYNYVSANYYLGMVYLRKNKQQEAYYEWKKVLLNKEPYFAEVRELAYRQLGNYHLSRRDYEEAISNYQNALQIDVVKDQNIRGEIFLGLGKSYINLREPNQSLEYLSMAVSLIPDNAEAHLYYGTALSLTGEHARSLAELQSALKLDPNGPFGDMARNLIEKLTP